MCILVNQSLGSAKIENLMDGERYPDSLIRVDAPLPKRRITNG